MCSIVRDPVALLGVGLGALAEQDVAGLPVGEVRGQLIGLLGQVSQLHAQVARRVAVFDAAGGGVVDAARSTKAWLRMVGRMSPSAASRLVNGARLLRDMPLLCAAAEDGLVSAEHVEKVVRLAERVSADVVAGVQEALTEVACRVDPGRLDAACARVRQHVDPDGPRPDPGVDFSRRGITLSRFDGMLLVRGQLDPEGGAAVLTALDALLTPPAAADDRSPAQRRADALVELARGALRAGRLPRVGGVRPQLGILLTPRNLMDQRNLMTSQILGQSASPAGPGVPEPPVRAVVTIRWPRSGWVPPGRRRGWTGWVTFRTRWRNGSGVTPMCGGSFWIRPAAGRWRWVAATGWCRPGCVRRCTPGIGVAGSPVVTPRRRGLTAITSSHGHAAAAPTWTTSSPCAGGTTAGSTTGAGASPTTPRPTRSPSDDPTAVRSPHPADDEPPNPENLHHHHHPGQRNHPTNPQPDRSRG